MFVDVAAVERATDPGGRGEQLSQLLARLAAGRNLHRATAYVGQRQTPSREGNRAQVIRDIGFHVVETIGAGISVALAVDLISGADDADVLTIVTGDASLEPAIAAARSKGARVEVVVCPGAGSEVLRAAADSAVAIGDLSPASQGQRPGRPPRPRTPADRPAPPSSAARGRGRPRPGGPSARPRYQEPERQEWPTPPPPSPEEMGIDPATRMRRPTGRPAPRPAPRPPGDRPVKPAPPDRPAPRTSPSTSREQAAGPSDDRPVKPTPPDRKVPRTVPSSSRERAPSPPDDRPASPRDDRPPSAPDPSPPFAVLEGERLSSPNPSDSEDGGGTKPR